VNDARNILLVADETTAGELAARTEKECFVRFADPYDALLAMRDRHWPVMVLSAGAADFAGLCRASRRLQPDSRVLGLCRPVEEPGVQVLVDNVLNDYLIHPPTRRELAELRRLAWSAVLPVAGGGPAAPALVPQELSRLVEATSSRKEVEDCTAAILSGRLAADLVWMDADKATARAQKLVELGNDALRVLVSSKPLALDPAGKALVAEVAAILPSLAAAGKRTESLHYLAITDHLTGAHNRRYFYHATDQILREAARKKLRATMLLYDIDDFKSYNDKYGHAVGDEILREMALLMKQITRSHDVVARIGGDEFTVLFWDKDRPRLPGSRPLESAFALANRFLAAVGAHRFLSLGPSAAGRLTISGGLASFPGDGVTCRELLRKADMALKAAKRSGKGAIRIVGAD
jgi:diguanylate cyclase (GGDEF)-like protein